MKHQMPKQYQGGKWVPVRARSVPVSSIRNPCAICGWAEHMAIHGVAAGTIKPIGPIGLHSYVSAKQEGAAP